VEAGIIFQHYESIFVASYQTKEIECDNQRYIYRKLKDAVLVNTDGIVNRGNYFAASKERAFLDMIYLHGEYYFDNLLPLDTAKVTALLPLYGNKRMFKSVAAYFDT
ncbi:MAG: hypothetical protein M1549_02175, partial [Candidatus Dependentiae bacterium]|nr:hypothetical protein [Candidatus Dependentiae bacterium]